MVIIGKEGRPLKKVVFSVKRAVRGVLLKFPFLYLLISRLRHRSDQSFLAGAESVTPRTDVLITGLPRTGNSFAVNAFRLAQKRPVRIAHHEYPPAQVVGAARYGIPTLVIIRQPDEVVVSRVASHPPLTLAQALDDYVQCYEALIPWRDRCVVATFEEVVSDFGSVTRRLNEKFNTDFAEFEHTNENVAEAFALIDGRYRTMGAERDLTFGRMVARPSAERNDAKAALKVELESPALQKRRERSWRVYRRMLSDPQGS